MNRSTTTKPPLAYWIVSTLACLWMIVGVLALFGDLMMDEAALAEMSEAVPFPMLIFLIGAGLLWFSLRARQRGWITRIR